MGWICLKKFYTWYMLCTSSCQSWNIYGARDLAPGLMMDFSMAIRPLQDE